MVIAFITLTASGPPQLPPLPNPNGYDTFVQAGKLLGNEADNLSESGFESLRSEIAWNGKPVHLMQLGLSQTCSVPTLECLTNMSSRTGDLAATKRLAQF